MIKFFSNNKIIFYFINFFFIILYIYPGSLIGLILYQDIKMQPQITPNFIISSNHFYVFLLISIIGFLSFYKSKYLLQLMCGFWANLHTMQVWMYDILNKHSGVIFYNVHTVGHLWVVNVLYHTVSWTDGNKNMINYKSFIIVIV